MPTGAPAGAPTGAPAGAPTAVAGDVAQADSPGDVIHDVVAVGNALVDVLARSDDEALDRLGLAKGTMALVDAGRSQAIFEQMGPTIEASGGSAANTAAGIAALGGRAAFLGRVADDALGRTFTHDIRAVGVTFDPVPAPLDGADTVTGHCLVLVTSDAERTMATHLGVASDFDSVDVHDGHIASARVLYLEGYLWERESAKTAMRRAIDAAHAADASVALSLSDPSCVERHRREFLALIEDDVDLLFANEDEVRLLFGGGTLFDAAVSNIEETGILAALTRGAQGALVVTPTGPLEVPAAPVAEVVDTTGAGDLFAAGFLAGITHGLAPGEAARLGALCAAEVISHVGARPQADLAALAAEKGLGID